MPLPDRLQKGHTFADGDIVDATTLNSTVDEGVALPGFISELPSVSANPADKVMILQGSVLKQAPVSSLPGVGTVTSVSFVANPGGVFNDQVLTPSTTPAITLDLAPQQPNKVLAGPLSGAMATPTFRVLAPVDLPIGTVTAGALDFNCDLGNVFFKQLPAGAGVTGPFTVSNMSPGQRIYVNFIQNNTGNRTITWNIVGLVWPDGGGAPQVSQINSGRDLFSLHKIGSFVYGQADQDFRT